MIHNSEVCTPCGRRVTDPDPVEEAQPEPTTVATLLVPDMRHHQQRP